MFQSVRQNAQLYILHRVDKPYFEIASVASQPVTKPKYSIPATFGTPQELVTDISVKVKDQVINLCGLPAQQDIADTYSNGESLVVADSKEAFNSEVLSLKQKSVDIVNSRDYNIELIDIYDKILSEVNPDYAEKQNQKEEISVLKNQVKEMSGNIAELMKTNALLVEKLSKGGFIQ